MLEVETKIHFFSFSVYLVLKINVWDTAGMEKTRSLTSNYYRNAHAVIFVYAIDDMYTLNALKGWVTDVNTDAKTALKFLVGNKTDLADEGFQVDKQQAESFRKNNGLHSVYEVSAKTGTGVKEMFENIGKLLVQNKKGAVQKKDPFDVIDTENENSSEKTSSSCCG